MMKIQLGMQGDIPMRTKTPGTYEWWYFDAVDEAQELAVTIILFDGMPMSPYWLEALPNANAEEYRGYAISVYHKRKKIAGFVHHTNDNHIQFEHGTLSIQMGDVRMERSQNGEYTIDIDTYFYDCAQSLKASFTCKPIIMHDTNDEIGEGNHCWRLIAPMCNFEGEFSLRQYQDIVETIQFSGHGYHDCNSGDDALDADYDDWYWGRIPLNEQQTLIYYHYPACSRHDVFSIAFIADKQFGLKQVQSCFIQEKNPTLTLSLMTIARSIEILGTIDQKTLHFRIQQSDALEIGPFYYRYLITAEDEHQVRMPFHGISEYFNAHRLRSRFVQMLIKTPMQSL